LCASDNNTSGAVHPNDFGEPLEQIAKKKKVKIGMHDFVMIRRKQRTWRSCELAANKRRLSLSV
jgi:hypothetical protein